MNEAFDWPAFLPAFREAAGACGFSETILTDTAAGPVSVWTRDAIVGPSIYLSAGIHGDEPAGPLAMLELMRQDRFSREFQWSLCPALNPTGLACCQRENADGIDLNRDYWKRSTAEVRAHSTWLESMPPPQLFLSLHEDWETRGFYLYEINLGRDLPERAHSILNAVTPWFPPEDAVLIDDHLPREPGWIYHEAEADLPTAWPEAICMAKLGCPLSFTFETPSQANLSMRIAAHRAAITTAIQSL